MFLAFFLFSGAVFGANHGNAGGEEKQGPHPASEKEKSEIQECIEGGVAAYDEFEKAKKEEAAIRVEIEALRKEKKDVNLELLEKWKKRQAVAEDAEKTMNEELKKAIEKTRDYFGISPEKHPIANGPLENISPDWNTRFVYALKKKNGEFEIVVRSVEIHRRGAAVTKHRMAVAFADDTAASTDEDGITSVSILAFREALRSEEPAGVLASTLYHESVHYEDLAVKGGWASKEKSEVSARGRALAANEIFGLDPEWGKAGYERWLRELELVNRRKKKPTELFPRNPAEAKKIQDMLADKENRQKREADRLLKDQNSLQQDLDRKLAELKERARKAAEERRHLGELDNLARGACITGSFDRWFLGQFQPRQSRVLYCEKRSVADAADFPCLYRVYHDMLGQLCDNGSIDADQLEGALRARFGGGPVEARPGPAVPPPGPEVGAISPPTAIFELADLAAKACAAPGSVTDADVRHLNWFPDRGISRWPAAREKLNDCSRPIFDALLGLNDSAVRGVRPNEVWINTTAQAWARAHPPEPPSSGPPEIEEPPEKVRTVARCYYDPELGQNVCPVR